MADTTAVTPVTETLNQTFLNWLKATPAALGKFIQIIKEFYAIQGETVHPNPPPGTVPGGPVYVRPGEGPPPLLTVPLTSEELDAMMEDRADAQVKEKALEFIKGFITGLMMGAH